MCAALGFRILLANEEWRKLFPDLTRKSSNEGELLAPKKPREKFLNFGESVTIMFILICGLNFWAVVYLTKISVQLGVTKVHKVYV